MHYSLVPKICEIVHELHQLPYTTYNDFSYYSRLYAEYIEQCVCRLHKVARKHVLEYALVIPNFARVKCSVKPKLRLSFLVRFIF